jgi:two-component system, NarL family, sensor kinase
MALSIRYPTWRSKIQRPGGDRQETGLRREASPESPGLAQSPGLVQAALDLLSARIAILDDQGIIVAVNESWRRYVEDGGAEGSEDGIGAKYLDFVKDSSHRELAEATQKIQEMLHGQEETVQFAYPGSCGNGQRWFQLSAMRFVEKGSRRLLICHEDVTEVRRAQEAQREIDGRILESREEERRRIARELHDGTVQQIFAVNLNLMSLKRLLNGGDRRVQELLGETVSLARECMQELRTISYLLRPPLHGHEFLPALSSYIDGFCKRSGIRVNLVLPMSSGRMPSKIENTLFRVVQEALSNIHRHSQSITATVALIRNDRSVVLEVKDQGKGMPQIQRDGPDWHAGGGLAGIEERLQELGGSLEIREANPGTVVAATIPLQPADVLHPVAA